MLSNLITFNFLKAKGCWLVIDKRLNQAIRGLRDISSILLRVCFKLKGELIVMERGTLKELNLQPGDLFYDFKAEQVYIMLDQDSICNFNFYDDVKVVLNIKTYKLSCFHDSKECLVLKRN